MAKVDVKGSYTTAISIAQRVGGRWGGFPNPDDPFEPRGPGGPVMMNAILIAALDRIAHRFKPQPQPWRSAEKKPQPDPWRDAFAVSIGRGVAEKAIELVGLGETIGGETGKSHAAGAASLINVFIDDYCGTPPRRKWPLPHGLEVAFSKSELALVAGQLAAGGAIAGVPALTKAGERLAAIALD